MKKILIYFVLLLLPVGYFSSVRSGSIASVIDDCYQLYIELQLNEIVDYTAFKQAYIGYKTVDFKNKDILTLIDFTKPSTDERMFVMDIPEKKILFSTHVSHGRNSGGNYATSFSNQNGSYKSSLGFYVTEGTYQGKNGYSLILNGLEKDINDHAKARAIVIHGADYCNPSVAHNSGRLGRSLGCPALPPAVTKSIINTIKGGTLLYIFANDENYLVKSTILANYSVLL